MIKEINNIKEFDLKTTKLFTNIYGKPCANDYREWESKELARIPEFDDLEMVAFKYGFENYSLIAGMMLVNILQTTKNANKQAQVFNVFIKMLYGPHDDHSINKYWKGLSLENKLTLDNVINDHLVDCYNYQVENLNYEENME